MKINFFEKFKKNFLVTKNKLKKKLITLFHKKTNFDNLLFRLEEILIVSDIGVNTTQFIIDRLRRDSEKGKIRKKKDVFYTLKKIMKKIVLPAEKPLKIEKKKPFFIIVVGVNGAGKTTMLGKIAHFYKKKNKKIMMAAGDTYRTAAIEQLKILGKKNDIPIVAQHYKSDPASVIFNALYSARANDTDILLGDTAGRLHNKVHLIQELQKIIRISKKFDSSAPHEIMLVIDTNIGQNALNQVRIFRKLIRITGIALTKLDGTFRGGIVFPISHFFRIPIRFLGFGEKMQDVQVFDANRFVNSIFTKDIFDF